MIEFRIQQDKEKNKDDSDKKKQPYYAATYLASVCINSKDMIGKDGSLRPALLIFAAPEVAANIFKSNLQNNKKAAIVEISQYRSDIKKSFETPSKQFAYKWKSQNYLVESSSGRKIKNSVVMAYMPDLVELKPEIINEESVEFISIPPRWWIEQEKDRLRNNPAIIEEVQYYLKALNKSYKFTDEQLVEILPLAYHFTMMLRERTIEALINGLDFYLHLYIEAIREGFVQLDDNSYKLDLFSFAPKIYKNYLNEENSSDVNFGYLVYCNITHEAIKTFVSNVARQYKKAQDELDKAFPERKLNREKELLTAREETQRIAEILSNTKYPEIQIDDSIIEKVKEKDKQMNIDALLAEIDEDVNVINEETEEDFEEEFFPVVQPVEKPAPKPGIIKKLDESKNVVVTEKVEKKRGRPKGFSPKKVEAEKKVAPIQPSVKKEVKMEEVNKPTISIKKRLPDVKQAVKTFGIDLNKASYEEVKQWCNGKNIDTIAQAFFQFGYKIDFTKPEVIIEDDMIIS